jgi:hypothetical protein
MPPSLASGWPSALVRLLAVAAFAFAGWIALSALSGAAHADAPRLSAAAPSRPAEPGGHAGHADPAKGRPTGDLVARPLDMRHPLSDSGTVRGVGSRVDGVTGAVSDPEIGSRPLHYLREQRQDVFDRKDRVIHRLQELGDAAGLPRVRVTTDVEPAPVVGGVAQGIVDAEPADGADQSEPVTDEPAKAAAADLPGGARAVHGAVTVPMFADHADAPDTGGCAGCRGDHREPMLPAGQDGPWNGNGGGHQLSPIADLMRGGRYPAIPAAVNPSMIDRTALADVFAPGGPSVVPD